MERALVGLAALVYAGIGLACLLAPVAVLAPTEIAPTGPTGTVELRAMYGGLELGMAGFLVWTLLRPAFVRAGLVAAVCSIGGLGLVRSAGWIAVQPEGLLMPALCAIEVGGALLGLWVLARGR